MTSTTFFSGSAPSPRVSSKRPAAASPIVRQAQPEAQAAVRPARAFARATMAYPWMTQALFAGMSPRARRLLRADY